MWLLFISILHVSRLFQIKSFFRNSIYVFIHLFTILCLTNTQVQVLFWLSYIKNSEWRLIRRGAPSSIACGKFPLMLMAFKTPDTMGWNNMQSNRTKNNKSFHHVIIIFICRSTSFWFQFSSLICTLTFTAHSANTGRNFPNLIVYPRYPM